MNKKLVLLAAASLLFGSGLSPSQAAESKVEVFRGGTVGALKSTTSSGVVVLRGTGSAKEMGPRDYANRGRYAATPKIVTSGRRLWIVDLSNDEIIQCSTRGTGYVGGRRIVCRSGSVYGY